VASALDGRESAFELHANGGIPAWRRAAAALLQPLQRAREPRHEERERRHAHARPRGSARSTPLQPRRPVTPPR
jgi:hypothetical protein